MTFDEYWNLLWNIKTDSDVEQYYDELLRPFFKEAIQETKNVKVIPTFDTRNHTKSNKYECITGSVDKLVWPDYIFVPNQYTHDAPVSPYIKVEFKTPQITSKNGQLLYFPINKLSDKFYYEILSESSEVPLIFTDGITWLFLRKSTDVDKIKSLEDIKTISLIVKKQKYYNGYYAVLSQQIDKIFSSLKEEIKSFITQSKHYKELNSDLTEQKK